MSVSTVQEQKYMLEVKDLKKHFKVGRGEVLKAVDGISFHIDEGETLGLVGESGCGKYTIGRTIARLYDKMDGDVYCNCNLVHSKKSIKQLKHFDDNVQ